jgi:4-hydroxy-2,2'-bipyrrole-5-carbaldehyde O-methyltransferase
MQLNTIFRLAKNQRVRLLIGSHFLSRAVYRANFLAAANATGVLRRLAERPLSFDEVASALDCSQEHREALADWLSVGALSGALRRTRRGEYKLRGLLAHAMAYAANGDAASALEEVTRLHAEVIFRVPSFVKTGQWFTLGDHDAVVAARASRALEPLMAEGIEHAIERFRPKTYLDVGCGTGIYLRYAADKATGLRGMGLDLNPDVAAFAGRKLIEWNLAERFHVEAGDFRDREPQAEYDLASLINNICYFDPGKRAEAVRHLTRFVRPGGGVLVAHPLRGFSAASDVVSLFFSSIRDAGPFPEPGEMEACLGKARLEDVRTHTIIPGVVAVTGRVPQA